MKLKLVIFVLFIAVNFVVYWVTADNKDKRIEKALDAHIEKLQSNHNTYEYEERLTANNFLSIVKSSTMKYLKQIPHASESELPELRKKIYQALIKPYKRMRNKGVYQIQFILPDNRSFLRIHKPDKFGDDLSKVRQSIAYTNQTKQPTEGFEAGKTTHGYRFVYPIFDAEGNYLCAFEISFSSHHLQNYFTKIMNLHTHYLIHESVFDAREWKMNEKEFTYLTSGESPEYLLVMADGHSVETCITDNKAKLATLQKEIKHNMEYEKPFALYVEFENKDKEAYVEVLSFKPVKGSNDKTLAWLVSYEKDDFIQDTVTNTNLIRAVLFVMMAFLFYFIYRVLNQKQQLESTQAELHEVIKEQESLFKAQNVGFVYTKNRVFHWTNREFEKLLGYAENELTNQSTRVIYADDTGYEFYGKNGYKVLGEKGHYSQEVECLKKDGTPITLMVSMTALKEDLSEAVGIFFDVTEKTKLQSELSQLNQNLEKEVEARVEELKEKHELLLKTQKIAKIGSWTHLLYDTNDVLHFSNEFYMIFEIDRSETFNAAKWIECVHPDDRQKVIDATAEVFENLNQEALTLQYKIITPQHNVKHLDVSWTMQCEADRLKRIDGTVQDITEKKLLAQQNLQNQKKVAMGELISIIAHQLKQPLNAMSLMKELTIVKFEDGEFTEDALKEFSEVMTKNIQFMSESIEDLRNFFRTDKEAKPFTLEEAVNKSLAIIGKNISSYGIEIRQNSSEHPKVVGIESELQQVVINILTNAKDSIVENEPKEKFIEIATNVELDKAVLTIADSGGGVPEDVMYKIFESDFTTKGEVGTGIGLNLSKMIIEGMSGAILVENNSYGAKFRIELPLCEDEGIG